MLGLGSTFLGFFKGGGGLLRFLLNPYVVGMIAAVFLLGYVYQKGKQAEKQRQADEIARLNTKLKDLSVREQLARAKEEVRLTSAVQRAVENIRSKPNSQCNLDKELIIDINRITRGL